MMLETTQIDKANAKESMKKNIIFAVLFMGAIATYFYLMSDFSRKNTDKKKQIDLLTDKANAAYQNEWIKFSKQSEFNAFVFETYHPCVSSKNGNVLICRTASVQLANVLHGELFAKRVDQSIQESINSVRADDSISKQLEEILNK